MTAIAILSTLVVCAPPKTFHVYASREGLVGKRTATGQVIKERDVFVALPDRSALGRTVRVSYGGRSVVARVADVGPWNVNDPYWRGTGVPAAANGKRLAPLRVYGKPRNQAGIDLSNEAWRRLKIPQSKGIVKVSWRFACDKR